MMGVVAMLATTSTALAAGTTSGTDSGSDSGSDSGTDSGTDTGADSGTTAADTGGFEEGSCGDCSPGADGTVTITAPADGATVESQFTVGVTATSDCSCDDCGCYDDAPDQITLTIDGAAFDQSCGSPCSFDLELAAGSHEIVAIADYDFHQNMASITVQVEADDDSVTGADDLPDPTDSAGESSSAGANDDEDESEGCSCRADAPGTGRPSAAFVLFGLFAAARRRRR